MGSQFLPGTCRTSEGDDILFVKVVKQVSGTTTNQLYGTFRKEFALDHFPDHRLGQVAPRGGRLDNDGHACRKSRSNFLQHSPARKIVGINVHRNARLGGEYVPANKASLGRQSL